MPIYCNHNTIISIPSTKGYESYVETSGLKEMKMDEFNSGVSHGFCMAKFALRDIDKQLSDCEGKDIYKVGKSNLYNIKKDFLYEIYEAINKTMKNESKK